MTQMTRVMLLACGLGLAASGSVFGQGDELLGRWFLNVNGGLQVANRELPETGAFPLYGESLTIEGTREIKSALLIDVAAGLHFAETWAVGIGYSRMSKGGDILVAASVPHPLFVQRPRAAIGTLTDLEHAEHAIHLTAMWRTIVLEGVDLKVGAGPSFYRLAETQPSEVTATEAGDPFDQVTLAFANASRSKNGVGFHVVGDATYLITQRLGAGVMLRYTAATIDMGLPGGGSRETKVGGFQFGGGLRLRF